MKYTNKDIYEGMEFINNSGNGSTFKIHEIKGERCKLTCIVNKGGYSHYKNQDYSLSNLIDALDRGEFVEVTKKEPVYEIY